MTDHDPLAEALDGLKRDWQQSSSDAPLPPGFESGELGDCDAATRASVEWLRAAHRARAAANTPDRGVPLPVQLAHARARRRAVRRVLTRPLLAVAGLAAAAVLIAVMTRRDDAPVTPNEASTTPVAGAPGAPAPSAPRETQYTEDEFRSRDDGIEIVSGNVRLVLLNR